MKCILLSKENKDSEIRSTRTHVCETRNPKLFLVMQLDLIFWRKITFHFTAQLIENISNSKNLALLNFLYHRSKFIVGHAALVKIFELIWFSILRRN
jgi:hypothetical protein